MKRFAFIALFCALTIHAQTFTDDLANKRSLLIGRIRDLGPLPPDNWSVAGIYSCSGESQFADFTYHSMGNFYNTSNDGVNYYYTYRNTGVWTYALPGKTTTGLRFDHFGLHEAALQPYPTYYHFAMDVADYNVAGLKYNGLFIVSGTDSSGNLLGWGITPGQSFFAGLIYSLSTTFDLLQNVETPSFQVADYYFGLYPNWPQDSKMPTPQNTQSQSSGALLVNGVGTTNLLIGWAKEGVYRPGFALPPGHSSPLLYTYMQQYFNGPWKCDPVTGQPPRTSTLNWNGIGKINTNSTIRTGSLSPSGYFIPTEPGEQIIVTRPLENGYYGEWPFYALQMLVDQNRDGVLNSNDVTTAANPHVFWVNNDSDRATYSTDDLWDEEDLQVTGSQTSDAQFVISKSRIPSLRDLEDYDRLHIRGLKELCRDLPLGQGYTITLRWKTILSGNPGIFVFKSADISGGSTYLTDPTTATAQIYPTLYPTNTSEPGASSLAVGRVESGFSPVLLNDTFWCTNDFFIYCGTSRGSGELAVSVYENSQLIGETSVFLNIRDVKELYERWTIGDGNGGTPATSPTLVSDGLPTDVSAMQFSDSTSSGRSYILFVHGWNMAPWEKDAFAETAFKRLYWQGYTNRFGSLRWPTTYGFSPLVGVIPAVKDIVLDPHNYDNGEFVAWHSAEGLRQHLLNLNSRYPGNVYMLAHSMGNVVAGEALALNAEKYHGGQIVNTYISSQAAVPLHCYDANAPPAYFIDFQHTPTILKISYPFANWDSGTANVYPGWLSTNVISCGARINFYNPHDYALSQDAWQFDEALKPDAGLTFSYQYLHFNTAQIAYLYGISGGSPPSHVIPSPARRGISRPLFRQMPGIFAYNGIFNSCYLDFEYNLNDMYEVMAYASEARTMPLGRVPDGLGKQIDIRLYWPTDTDPNDGNGVYGRPKWHSGEFNFNNMSQNFYWGNLLGQNGFGLF